MRSWGPVVWEERALSGCLWIARDLVGKESDLFGGDANPSQDPWADIS